MLLLQQQKYFCFYYKKTCFELTAVFVINREMLEKNYKQYTDKHNAIISTSHT